MSSDPAAAHQSRHPTLKQYVAIAIFLFVVTLIEFVIILPPDGFLGIPRYAGAGWTIAPLAILSAIKFAAVIFFYMHLKFDNPLLTWVFLGGLALGFAVVFALIGLFGTFTPSPRAWAQANAEPCLFDHEHGGCAPLVAAVAAEPAPADGETDTDGGTETPAAAAPAAGGGLAAQGQAVFTGAGICMTCHTIDGVPGAVGIIGPDLTHIATEAATRQPGVSARDYITTSIVDPESFVATGIERATPGLMTAAIVANLSDADVEALVEFLLQQE